MTFVKVAKTTDIQAGSVRSFTAGDKKIALVNLNGKIHALEDRCPHQGQPLSGGMVVGESLMCLFHGAQFDVATGKPLNTVSKDGAKTVPVKIEGDEIFVDV